MDAIVNFFASQGMDFFHVMTLCGLLLVGTMIISLLARAIWGKKSLFNSAVSSAIGILFIYSLSLAINAFAVQYFTLLPALPFSEIRGSRLYLFPFLKSDYVHICSQLLSMIVLAFIMNLIDNWMPEGKKAFSWFLLRIFTVLLAAIIHGIAVYLFNRFLPREFALYSPVILLAVLLLMLLTGSLKLLVGLAMATVNPLIAALYTFFFANIVGKQVTKAVLTTAILACFVLILQYFSICSLSVSSSALIAYLPFGIVLLFMWRIVQKSL